MPTTKQLITVWILGNQHLEQHATAKKEETNLDQEQIYGQLNLYKRDPHPGGFSINKPSQLNLGAALEKLSEA